MKMKTTKSLPLVALMAILALFTSCNKEPKGGTLPSGTLFDIVTLTANPETGAVFEFQKDGDSPVITLYSSTHLPDTYKIGQRMLIAYEPTNGVSYVSGAIVLYGIQSVLNGDIEIGTASQWQNFMTQDQRLTYITRTGQYLNVQADVYVLSQPKTYALVCDESTLDSAWPVCYIIFISDTQGDGRMIQGRASWNISQVWNRENVEGIKVRLANTDGPNEFTFKKDGNQLPVGK